MYKCRIERDSRSPLGNRAVTFVVTYPRVCLAEVLTHRVNSETWGDDVVLCERSATTDTSKSSASSRAIPFERMVDSIKADPYMPMWTGLQKGMQGKTISDDEILAEANDMWREALDNNIATAQGLHALGIHKQDCNRLLEPWAWVTQVVTSSRWDNFFALRCHPAAFPPFRKIARMMYLDYKRSTPRILGQGEWHLPFIDQKVEREFNWTLDFWTYYNHTTADSSNLQLPDLIRFSAARCAWVSYENHDKDASPQAHLNTFNRLLAEVPVHASPIEHQLGWYEWLRDDPTHRRVCGNIPGFAQARKLIKQEVITNYEPTEEEIATWDDVKGY